MPDMKTGTTTETLADVLRELETLAPDRFRDAAFGWDVGDHDWPIVLQDDTVHPSDHGLVLQACMEECEAHGWSWNLSGADPYGCTVEDRNGVFFHVSTHGSPALALATALRDALRAAG